MAAQTLAQCIAEIAHVRVADNTVRHFVPGAKRSFCVKRMVWVANSNNRRTTEWESTVPGSVELDPAVFVPAFGIVMRPVHDTALFVVDVLASKADEVALIDWCAAEREIVCDLYRNTAHQFNEKVLVLTRAVEVVIVIGQDMNDFAGGLDLNFGFLLLEEFTDPAVRACGDGRGRCVGSGSASPARERRGLGRAVVGLPLAGGF